MEGLGGWEAGHVGPRKDTEFYDNNSHNLISSGLNIPIVDTDTKEDQKKILINYFSGNGNNHKFYLIRFFFCELLNLSNVVGQVFFMDFFLGGEFSTYGMDVLTMLNMEQDERSDPMARVFPKVT